MQTIIISLNLQVFLVSISDFSNKLNTFRNNVPIRLRKIQKKKEKKMKKKKKLDKRKDNPAHISLPNTFIQKQNPFLVGIDNGYSTSATKYYC